MKGSLIGVVAAMALCLAAGVAPTAALADVPSALNFSGRLGSDEGDFNGVAQINLAIYDDPLSFEPQHLLWADSQTVMVDQGRFHLLLGADPLNPLPEELLLKSELFVGVAVDKGEEMEPRIRVASVPYALRAREAGRLGGKEAADFAAAGHTHEGFLATGQVDSIAGGMVVDGSLTLADLGASGCAAGEVAKWDGQLWACAVDADTQPIEYSGADFAISGQQCEAGARVVGADELGLFVCEPDLDTQYLAGKGLTLADGMFSLDQATVTGWAKDVCYDKPSELYAVLNDAYASFYHFHDDLYVGIGQPDSVTSGMIVDGTIKRADLSDCDCQSGQVLKLDDGHWICAGDLDTHYSGKDFALSGQSCQVGQVVTGINGNGLPVCGLVSKLDPALAGTFAGKDELAAALKGLAACTGQGFALQWDGQQWLCSKISQAGASGGKAKGFEVVDPWDLTFDGAERYAATWAAADAACKSLNGRLPTITELYRDSQAASGSVGSSYETNYLWSRTPWSGTEHTTVRLTDGTILAATSTLTRAYRCVWPAAVPEAFTGSNCFSELGQGCFKTIGESKMAMDRLSRPAVSYVAAVDECGFYRSHLAHSLDYAENVPAGLPNGPGVSWHWTSDSASYSSSLLVRWTGVDPAFVPYGSSTYQNLGVRGSGPFQFRCKGVTDAAVGAHPNAIADEYVATQTTRLKGQTVGNVKQQFGASASLCWGLGGHLAHERDLMELIRHGLPNGVGTGSNDWVWTSDRSHYDRTNVVRWSAIDTAFTDFSSNYTYYASLLSSGGAPTLYYRCAFYPLDPDFGAPAATDCFGGTPCFQASTGGASKRDYWADAADRPKATWISAVKECNKVRGRLPNQAQMTELIRAGLVAGSNQWLWTSDLTVMDGYTSSSALTVRWDGTAATFGPLYQGPASSMSLAGTSELNYRCVWTNELW